MKKTPYGKYYDIILTSDRWLKEHNAQNVGITSDDGLNLQGLWIPAEQPRGTILFAHGYRSTFLVDFGPAFAYYHGLGMNILVPYQRAHGLSQGRYITFGVKESGDMLRWLEFHNRTFGEFPVILDGLSMGASTMMNLADKELPNNVKGIIADCGFTSPKEIVRSVFKRVLRLPAAPSIWVADILARLFAGFSFNECDTRKILANNKLPIIMVHGTADKFVPCEMTRQGYDACSGPKTLFLVEGAGHGLSFLHDAQGYTRLITELLDTHIGKQNK
ncbi:MAG: alpha/beta hydrolase [Oscillospiraceae bacterium]|nr:alpha/beta hydrolase [Oscillospiraceae bacterium]